MRKICSTISEDESQKVDHIIQTRWNHIKIILIVDRNIIQTNYCPNYVLAKWELEKERKKMQLKYSFLDLKLI